MDVLNDLSLHKQYQSDCFESGSELKNWDFFCGPSIFKQASTFLQVAMPNCGSTLEASTSRTGSPNESLLNKAVFKQDVLNPSNTKKSGGASTVPPLSCHPFIKKRPKRGWNPATTSNALKKELECSHGDSLLDELMYPSPSPFSMDHSLKMNPGHVYVGNDNGDTVVKDQLYDSSASKQSYGDGKLSYYLQGDTSSKQSLEDGSELTYAYAKSLLEDSASENSTSNNVFGSTEILHPVMFDQSTLMEYVTNSLETWFEDPFLNTGGLQSYADDGNFIKKEEPKMAIDEEERLSCGYKRSEAAHSQGFLAHTECRQGNSSIIVGVNEGIEAPPLDHHLRIDFEDSFVQLHNLGQDGNSSAEISACTQFCPPKPIFGALHSNNTMQKLHVSNDGGLHGSFATYTSAAAENKPFTNYTDGRQLNGMYGDTSIKSCKSCVSEGSKVPKSAEREDHIDACKTIEGGLWVSNAGDVFSKFDARTKNKYTDLGLVRILTVGAEAVARRDMNLALVMLARLKSSVSSLSNAMQRVIGYFIKSLEHQIEGAKRIDHASSNIKSQGDILAAFQILHEIFPYIKFGHFTANQAILEAVQGAKRVQIVDFEIMEGIQWPAFMQALVSRKGAPPELHITALCRPHWEHGLAMVQKTGKRLSEFASTLGLPFSFSLLTMEHDEAFDASKLQHVDGEALVVNCMVHLPHMPRRSMTSVVSFLQGMRELSPTVITLVEEELGCNTNAAASYFSEALFHFHAICDSLEACLPTDVEARMLVEKVFMAPRIDSAVAMWSWAMPTGSVHGMEPSSSRYKWSTVMHSAGFKPLPLSFHSQSQAKLLLGLHRDGFCLEERSHYLVLGWQSKPLFAASVWN